MTLEEFQFIKRAVDALEQGEQSIPSQIKLLKTISQITAKSAQLMEQDWIDRFEEVLYNSNTQTEGAEHA
jgi:hypothetical protein